MAARGGQNVRQSQQSNTDSELIAVLVVMNYKIEPKQLQHPEVSWSQQCLEIKKDFFFLKQYPHIVTEVIPGLVTTALMIPLGDILAQEVLTTTVRYIIREIGDFIWMLITLEIFLISF